MVSDPAIRRRLAERAERISHRLEADVAVFEELPDQPGQRVHALYAALYAETARHWYAYSRWLADPDLAYLVLIRFYDLYAAHVVARVAVRGKGTPRQWRHFFRFADGLAMASPISRHLAFLALGVRAHIRHDLGPAIEAACREYAALFGRPPDLAIRAQLVGSGTGEPFYRATLRYIAAHRAARRGYRRFVLGCYGVIVRGLGWFWVPVMQSWRRAAWAEAMAGIEPVPADDSLFRSRA